MRQSDVLVARDVPAFRLVFLPDNRTLQAWLPSGRHPSHYSIRSKAQDGHWAQKIDLPLFVRGALSGALRFDPLRDAVAPLSIALSKSDCWKCHKAIRIVHHFRVHADRVCPGFESFSFSLSELDTGNPAAERWIAEHLPPDRLSAHNVGPVKPRFSKTANERYLSNACLYCGALQGRFFEHEVMDLEPVLLPAQITLSNSLLEACGDSGGMRRWWFDEAQHAQTRSP